MCVPHMLRRRGKKLGNGRPASAQPSGTPEHVIERLAPLVELGYRHINIGFPSPYDEETMTRMMQEVHPKLAAMVSPQPVS